MADGGHLENQKSRYLRNVLADFDEILYDGTSSRGYQLIKKSNCLKSKMADGCHFQNC